MAGLSGMKDICTYCSRSETTVLKWIRSYNFPASKIDGCWESDRDMIDAWRKKRIAMDLDTMEATP